jgi:monofunctional biosynthetic peptidoglycan transglycosylase
MTSLKDPPQEAGDTQPGTDAPAERSMADACCATPDTVTGASETEAEHEPAAHEPHPFPMVVAMDYGTDYISLASAVVLIQEPDELTASTAPEEQAVVPFIDALQTPADFQPENAPSAEVRPSDAPPEFPQESATTSALIAVDAEARAIEAPDFTLTPPETPPAAVDLELSSAIRADNSLAPPPSAVAPPRFHAPPAAPAIPWDRLPPQERVAPAAPSRFNIPPPSAPAVEWDRLPPEPPRAPPAKPVASSWRTRLRRLAIILLSICFGYAALVAVLIGVYRFVDPPRSTVMLGVHLSGESVDYRPVSIGNISSYLQRAVITSEDARFCRHWGVDWAALYEAMQDSRGGSTITMQTAKNLFLWPSRSYIRKAIEIPVALAIDLAWPKRRILEVYLNIAEWGPGIFGAEAAAWYHFDKPASRLTPQEATLLAASLPNPIAREAGDPGRVTELLAARLRGRMANSDAYVGCLGLRQMPRLQQSEPSAQRSVPKTAPKPSQWQTKTEPTKPETPKPFNPWQN